MLNDIHPECSTILVDVLNRKTPETYHMLKVPLMLKVSRTSVDVDVARRYPNATPDAIAQKSATGPQLNLTTLFSFIANFNPE